MAGSPLTKKVKQSVAEKIVIAAVACFERFGEAKTSMQDIADAAGIGRQTLYRTFENRNLLLEAVVMHFSEGHVRDLKPMVSNAANFEDAVVRGTVGAIQITRRQEVLEQCLAAIGAHALEQFIMRPDSPVFRNTVAIYREAITKARKAKRLRSSLTDDDVAGWLLNIHYILMVRTELSQPEQEELVRKFVIPALVKDKN